MSQKVNRRAKMTKLLLKTSLKELMHEKPINRITIRELCENADVNRSTFYLYYKDQYDLLNEIEKELLQQAQMHLERIDSDYGSVQYLENLLGYIIDNEDIFKTLLCTQENAVFQSAFIDMSFVNIKDRLGLKCAEPVLTYIYDFLLAGCLSMIKTWIKEGFNISCKEMADLIFKLSDRAVAEYI